MLYSVSGVEHVLQHTVDYEIYAEVIARFGLNGSVVQYGPGVIYPTQTSRITLSMKSAIKKRQRPAMIEVIISMHCQGILDRV